MTVSTLRTVILSDRLYFLGLQNHCRWWLQPWNKKMLAAWKKSYDQPRQHIKKQRHYFADKSPSTWNYGFSSSHAWMWELDYKESWAPKNWCFWTVVLKSPSDCRRSNQSILKEISPEYSLDGLMLKLKVQYLATWCEELTLGKDPDAGKDWRWEEKGTTEDEMAGWHHQLNGHEFEQTPGDSKGQGSLVGCSPWGRKESDTIGQLNSNKYKQQILFLVVVCLFQFSLWFVSFPTSSQSSSLHCLSEPVDFFFLN